MSSPRTGGEPPDLVWGPGSMQADFGQADFDCSGRRERKHYLTASWPYSNAGFSQVSGLRDRRMRLPGA